MSMGQTASGTDGKGRPVTTVREGEDGHERYCGRCHEWWPADSEFFHRQTTRSHGLSDWCRACYGEWRASRRSLKPEPAAPLVWP